MMQDRRNGGACPQCWARTERLALLREAAPVAAPELYLCSGCCPVRRTARGSARGGITEGVGGGRAG